MANRRTIKRDINAICRNLMAECLALSLYDSKAGAENIAVLFVTIFKMKREFIRRVSHVEPGIKAKVYFKDFHEKFNNQVCDIIDQMNNMN